jgi:two-component system, NarL family, response regulator LiaR
MNTARPGDPLSRLEEEILPYVAEGCTNGEIGRQVGRTPSTIKARLSRLYAKTDTNNRLSLVVWAFRNGILK